MIKIRKLGPAELAEMNKKYKKEPIVRLTKYFRPIYLPNIDEILALDEFVGVNFLADFYLLHEEEFIPRDVVDSAKENHFEVCEFCINSEPCPNLPSILAA